MGLDRPLRLRVYASNIYKELWSRHLGFRVYVSNLDKKLDAGDWATGFVYVKRSSCTWLSARSRDAKVVVLGKGLTFASVPTVRAHLGYPAND